MNPAVWQSVPAAIMAGISAYAAVLFLGFYLALTRAEDRRVRREYLTFALLCLAVTGFDVSCAGFYNARSVAVCAGWQRLQIASADLCGVAYVVFAWDFVGRKLPGAVRVCIAVELVLAGLVAFLDSPWTVDTARPDIKHVTVGRWLDIVYYEASNGILVTALLGLFFALFAYGLLTQVGPLLARKRSGALGFLFAVAMMFATALNDSLVATDVYKFAYTLEYGLASMLMAMSYVLVSRFRALQNDVIGLNEGLARTNADLLVALTAAHESGRAKTEFLASISHELRTPLNAIINLPEGILDQLIPTVRARCGGCNAELELDSGETTDATTACPACGVKGRLVSGPAWRLAEDGVQTRRHLETVARAGHHLLGLVNDILDASKLELGRATLSRGSVSVGELLVEVADSLRPLADEAKVAIQATDHPGPLAIVADRVKVAQVLYNLIANAIKFSPPASTIELGVTTPDPAHVLFHCRDHGIGIAKEHHEAIFEKFRQVHDGSTRAYGGTGLGLAISKSLVELHGGRLWVESAPGAGSTFFVLLPREDSAPGG
jgi:signal transduction histidine kinase